MYANMLTGEGDYVVGSVFCRYHSFTKIASHLFLLYCTTLLAWYMLSSCVRLSIHPSVTRRYCTKTAKHRIMQTMPYDSSGTLVFWCQRYRRNSNGVTVTSTVALSYVYSKDVARQFFALQKYHLHLQSAVYQTPLPTTVDGVLLAKNSYS